MINSELDPARNEEVFRLWVVQTLTEVRTRVESMNQAHKEFKDDIESRVRRLESRMYWISGICGAGAWVIEIGISWVVRNISLTGH